MRYRNVALNRLEIKCCSFVCLFGLDLFLFLFLLFFIYTSTNIFLVDIKENIKAK